MFSTIFGGELQIFGRTTTQEYSERFNKKKRTTKNVI